MASSIAINLSATELAAMLWEQGGQGELVNLSTGPVLRVLRRNLMPFAVRMTLPYPGDFAQITATVSARRSSNMSAEILRLYFMPAPIDAPIVMMPLAPDFRIGMAQVHSANPTALFLAAETPPATFVLEYVRIVALLSKAESR